jgi:carbon storage regulator
MLVLSRKPGEKVVIGDVVTLTLLSCNNGRIRLAIAAPEEIRILRGELLDRQEKIGQGTSRCSEGPSTSIELVEVA